MEKYVKVNRKVVEFLGLQNDRTQFKDGCFLLWMQDLMVFGSLINFGRILSQIGAIPLTGEEARQEQDGVMNRPLPTATDERFIIETASQEDSSTGSEDVSGSEGAGSEEGSEEAASGVTGSEGGDATEQGAKEPSAQTKEEEG
jgi:hypothetical protein